MIPNKITVISAITILALLVVGGGIAFAQAAQPGWGMAGYGMPGRYGLQSGTPAPGYGMMGGSYGMLNGVDMNAMHQWMSTTSGMHTIMGNGLADVLGLTPEEFNTQLASGKTLAQIAKAQGMTPEQLAAALETSVRAGLDQAVADGVLTQAQADQMLSRMDGNYAWMITHIGSMGGGFGPGGCYGDITPQGNS